MPRAVRSAASSCVPGATTRLTRPIASASAAGMRSSALRMMRLACLGLVIQGSSSVTMPAPNFNSGSPNTASSLAMVMSQAIASSKAPARQAPCTAAMVGLGLFQKRIVVSKSRSRISRQTWAPSGRCSICAFRSKPDENARPAPLTTITRTCGSASAWSIAWLISISAALSNAFSRAGRFSTSWATWSVTVSVMA